MRQFCPLTVTIILMSDKMNPLWKYFILDLLPKIHSASKYIPSNSPRILLGMIGRLVAFIVHIQVKGKSELFGADLPILTVLPGQFDEASSWIKSCQPNQVYVTTVGKPGVLGPGQERHQNVSSVIIRCEKIKRYLLLTKIKIYNSINDLLFSLIRTNSKLSL